MKRILLFLATNLAIIVVLSITLRILGVERILDEQGVGLNMTSLLIFAAVFGMGGSFLSLAMSKWTAKRFTGAQVIEQPRTPEERWLVETVQRQARAAGIGMPEVAIYDAPDINAFATGMSRNKALVAVSTGLLRSMSRDEAEAVLGHEVSHIANGDMITLALIQGVVNTFVIFLSRVIGHLVDRVVFKNRARPRPGVLGDRHRRRTGAGHTRQYHRDVVQPLPRVPRRCGRCPVGRAAEDDQRLGALGAGAQRAFARSVGGLRYFWEHRPWFEALVHDPSAAGRTHCRLARARLI